MDHEVSTDSAIKKCFKIQSHSNNIMTNRFPFSTKISLLMKKLLKYLRGVEIAADAPLAGGGWEICGPCVRGAWYLKHKPTKSEEVVDKKRKKNKLIM